MLSTCEMTFEEINAWDSRELYDTIMSGKICKVWNGYEDEEPLVIDISCIEFQEEFFNDFYSDMFDHLGYECTMADEPRYNYPEIDEYIDSLYDGIEVLGKKYLMSEFLWNMDIKTYTIYMKNYLDECFISFLIELVDNKKVNLSTSYGGYTYIFEEGDNYDNIYRV